MKKQDKKIHGYYKKIYLCFILVFAIILFRNPLEGTVWFHVLGIIALIGVVIGLYYFIKLLKEKKK